MRRTGALTGRGQTLLWTGVVTALAGVVLGYPDVTRIGLLLLGLPLLALLLTLRRPPSVRVTRRLEPVRLRPDEQGHVEVGFTNVDSRRTPMYLAEEVFDYALGDRPRFVLPPLSPGEQRRLRYAVRSRHRGAYQLGPVTLRQRDAFGLTHVALQLPATAEVLVLPQVFALAGRQVRGQGRGTEGELPQMVALHGEDDVSIRSYRDGDELRRVHWPATAHRGELMVRQEDRPTRRRALLLLDSRSGAHPGDAYRPTFEWAVSALASVATRLVADGFVVHLLTDATVRDGTAGDPIELGDALGVLARAQPEPSTSLEPLAAAAHAFTSGGVLVVAAVSAHDEGELRHLASIREPGSAAYALVLDGSARESEPAGPAATTLVRDTLGQAGWSTVTVSPRSSIPGAWEDLRRVRLSVGA